MVRLPKKYADVPLPAVQAVVAQLVAGKGADEMQQDTKALEAAQVGGWGAQEVGCVVAVQYSRIE